MDKTIKLICGTVGGIIGFLFGELDGLLTALLTVIVIDYATGLICVKINKNLSSSVGFKGLAKKGFMLSIVVIANIIDTQVIKAVRLSEVL